MNSFNKRFRCCSLMTTTWSNNSRRSVPPYLSTNGFCQGHRWALFDFCNPTSHDKPAHLVSVQSVVVTEQIAGLLTKRHGFPQLLDHPSHRRMRRHSKMHDLATRMIQDHKNVQDLKANSRHREDGHGPGHFEVISQEGQPGLGLVRSSLKLDHILPDGIWAGWIETE